MSRRTRDHVVACLLGGAIGDAMGNALEQLSLAQIRAAYGDAGARQLIDPSFTDDTQLTLFTAEGLIRARLQGQDTDAGLLATLHHAYLRWLHTQGEALDPALGTSWLLSQPLLHARKAPGDTCLEALRAGWHGQREVPINQSKGCGGLMRVAPIGLSFVSEPDRAFALAASAAALTHGHPSGYLAAGYFAALLALLGQGRELADALDEALPLLTREAGHEECLARIAQARALASRPAAPGPEQLEGLGTSGGVLAEEALGMALCCALSHPRDYRAGVLMAINHSGDSDVVGELTGQILGLLNGIEAIPPDWLIQLEGTDIVTALAGDLYMARYDTSDPELLARHAKEVAQAMPI